MCKTLGSIPSTERQRERESVMKRFSKQTMVVFAQCSASLMPLSGTLKIMKILCILSHFLKT
jgi:hypothetical protein